MKRTLISMAISISLGVYLFIGVAAAAEPTRYTVVFKGNTIPKKASGIVTRAGGELVKVLPEIGVGIAVSDDPNFADSLRGAKKIHSVGVERFQALPPTELMAIEYGEESAPVAEDWLYFYQWDIRRVRADDAWPVTSGSHDTVVAVVDTGIAWNHPDLAANEVYSTCYSFTGSCTDYPDASFIDGGWHGTHVAGTIAAAFGGGAAVGVGPNLGLANYKVFEDISGCGYCAYDGSIWEAMLDATARGFDVINLSLGGYVVKPRSREDVAAWTAWNRVANYVTRQGLTIVASAGNDDFDLNGPVDHIPSDLPNVICVGATAIRPHPFIPEYDARAFYSNYGAAVTLVAPGGDEGPVGTPFPDPGAFYMVFSTFVSVPGSPVLPPFTLYQYDPGCEINRDCPCGYMAAWGTSMAAPHVAGAAALVIDQNPGINPHQVRAILKRTAEDLGDRQEFGHGMLDVFGAVSE